MNTTYKLANVRQNQKDVLKIITRPRGIMGSPNIYEPTRNQRDGSKRAYISKKKTSPNMKIAKIITCKYPRRTGWHWPWRGSKESQQCSHRGCSQRPRRGCTILHIKGVTKRCRLSLLTNSALVIRVQMRGEGGGELRGLSQWVQLCTSRDMEPK